MLHLGKNKGVFTPQFYAGMLGMTLDMVSMDSTVFLGHLHAQAGHLSLSTKFRIVSPQGIYQYPPCHVLLNMNLATALGERCT